MDPESEEYRLINPVVSKLDKEKKRKQAIEKNFEEVEVRLMAFEILVHASNVNIVANLNFITAPGAVERNNWGIRELWW